MATTVTIPLTTLQIGTSHYGPATLASGFSQVDLSVDRTAGAFSINSTPAATITISWDLSFDNGVTWLQFSSSTAPGGPQIDPRTGQPFSAITLGFTSQGLAGTPCQMQATVQVTGAKVSVSGTLTIS